MCDGILNEFKDVTRSILHRVIAVSIPLILASYLICITLRVGGSHDMVILLFRAISIFMFATSYGDDTGGL